MHEGRTCLGKVRPFYILPGGIEKFMISDWEKAYADMLKFEGGYANHPADRGGETYMGIARKVWKKWKGWEIVDHYKTITSDRGRLNELLSKDKKLQKLVKAFYKRNFWDKVHGDELPSKLARKTFDTAVNMGTRWGIRLLQKALNGINIHRERRGQRPLFRDLEVDGIYGRNTRNAINVVFDEYGKEEGQELILDWYSNYQAERYHAIVTRNPSQKVFLKGWLRRAAYRGE